MVSGVIGLDMTDAELHPVLCQLYALMIGVGVGSFIHHAVDHKHIRVTIVIDYVCIIWSVGTIAAHAAELLPLVTWLSWAYGVAALLVLLTDHVWTPLPVPIGHCLWHLLAAWAMDHVYGDMKQERDVPPPREQTVT